ncbi:MAG: UDP-N-acetylmuramoyl-L-alanyl-D-glutamate--2,6-diaminopimelate ligase [Magnetococcales bacterium]|nr:UDP-N-acetylmuramoyl-L-alanyl-D-glutamate--2,6-diaminopimelate ligase [Magnetococcales bacterium]
MRLARLLTEADPSPASRLVGQDCEITALTADSRRVTPGALFAALSGTREDGVRFVDQALAAGATAILHDGGTPLGGDTPQWIHPEPRLALALAAATWHGHPAREMRMAAVTGSNGKTTVAAMVEAILRQSGIPAGVIGTTGIRYPGKEVVTGMTTPDPITLHRSLRAMRTGGCRAVVAEVSSHALSQRRSAGIRWDAAAFTNLSRDHLDYHGSMEAYWQAKLRLFADPPRPGTAILNLDDPRGRELADACPGLGIPVLGFALEERSRAAFVAHDLDMAWQQNRFRMATPGRTLEIALGTGGRFNIANALAAAAIGWSLGAREEGIEAGLLAFRPVKGRLETINAGQPFTVIVDFAHTPDALERLLVTAGEITPHSRRLLLFGCGGERDAGKREMMGRIAGEKADLTILTDDNPRSEDPESIRKAVLTGIRTTAGACVQIPSRDEAIAHALAHAMPGDVVLIAGKGHETEQITATGSHPFDDAQTARRHLARMGFKED